MLSTNKKIKIFTPEIDISHEIDIDLELLLSFEEEGYTYLHCVYVTSPKYDSGW